MAEREYGKWSRRGWAGWALALLGAASALPVQGCHGADGAEKPKDEDIPLVEVMKPIVADVPVILPYTADIQAIFQEKAVPEMVNGFLTAVNVENGQFVHKGDVIASIDKAPYLQKLQEAQENLAKAKAEVRNNQLLVERYGKMLQAKLIAQQDFDNQQTALDVTLAGLQRAQDAIKLAKVYLDYCDVRAPFTGYASERLLDPGQYVSPQGPAIAMLMKIDTLRIFVDVIETEIPEIKLGEQVSIHVDAYPDRTFLGKITYIEREVHPSTRTMRVEVDLANDQELLKPGMYARVGVLVGTHPHAVVVPDLALAVSTQGASVFPVRDGKMARQAVQIVYDMGRYIEVSGLNPEEQIVVAGRDSAKLGEAVKAVPTSMTFNLKQTD
ncbi:MAG: efflux RND transporter periplasmic adaptor subunit [Myxococcales bacterium]